VVDLQAPAASRVPGDPAQGVTSAPEPAAAVSVFPSMIAAMPASPAQRRTALGIVIIIFLIEAVAAPFAASPAARADNLALVLQTALWVVNLVTAAILFSQYSIHPSRGTLAVASGYLFSALLAFAQTLAFPGRYSAVAVIGDGRNTDTWLFVLGQGTFALMVIIYGLSKQEKVADRSFASAPAKSVLITMAWVLAAAAVLTWLVSAGAPYLPNLYISSVPQTNAVKYANAALWLIYSAALVVLSIRRRTLLDLWLIVTLFAWWPNFLMTAVFTVNRFSIVWYLGCCLTLIVSSALLFVLLAETAAIYAHLASAIILLRRDRDVRLASVEAATAAMAHEVLQPLTGIASAAAAGLNWLTKTPPVAEKAATCFASIISTSHRAEEMTSRIRAAFKRTPKQRSMVQLNDLCRDVVRLLRYDLLANGISVTTDYQRDIPKLSADATELQQAIFILLKNGIEAVSSRPMGDKHLRLVTRFEATSTVALRIQDTGPGIPAEVQERLFEPLVAPTATGMGLELMICRAVAEQHGGALRLCGSDAHGSTFEMTLPVAPDQGHP
jgi:signal transduction histidine kinase